MKAFKHFCTITHHKLLVMKDCFKLGMIRQGLLHDLSKYGYTEFHIGCKYYKGYMSPNNAERTETGLSTAWLHHKGRNKHHLEYWIDYGAAEDSNTPGAHKGMMGMKMPVKYVAEMLVDRISACKNYQKDKYTTQSPLIYYNKGKGVYLIHPDTESLLEYLLVMLSVCGEKETYRFVRKELLKGKVPYEKQYLDKQKEALLEKHDL